MVASHSIKLDCFEVNLNILKELIDFVGVVLLGPRLWQVLRVHLHFKGYVYFVFHQVLHLAPKLSFLVLQNQVRYQVGLFVEVIVQSFVVSIISDGP